ncbi:1,2-phenylacetyl-CoA epoxidase subunit PaaD [Streptomyces sp. CB01881]|uniref:1,2-phenylacetyl-CoA epoxidase subunit PaaD n=1 Tax=Streptomyces sp. CB01881 TaxID=2078691 RepID=UPI000CDC7E94|nr:1,2-phenylacetyl-CoA epoxidase subunit PaaD [Streptomyces sp. CB01881]AUY48472.1 phenylacetate-CoA oxygenase subunit PaaJ [Streptomyces sp. CB01881]TYC76961.1 phenylacetate-CoA oxygenase subunit PaaJ [Streptomyces sp. CB01881]
MTERRPSEWQLAELRSAVEELPDPELPMVTLGDLGVVHAVRIGSDGTPEVELTPTFLGCPAMEVIERAVRGVLAEAGHPAGRVHRVLVPAWSTDRISERGRRRLAEHGIAPPGRPAGAEVRAVTVALGPPCPHCGSQATRPLSPFGATRCQAILLCTACRETFAQFRAG